MMVVRLAGLAEWGQVGFTGSGMYHRNLPLVPVDLGRQLSREVAE